MTTEQQDWNDNRVRLNTDPTHTGLYELVHVTSDGDFRESWTVEETVSIHRTELGAYKAGIKSGYIVRPLKVAD